MRIALPAMALVCAAACITAHAEELAATLTTLYQFPGGGDGLEPWSGLVSDGGLLYGTSLWVAPMAAVHSFNFIGDGVFPQAGLLIDGSTLYGATLLGAKSNAGEVFSYAPASAKFSTVYTFTGGADGAAPGAALIRSGATLYGASSNGATYNTGVVFSLVP